jgi:flagellar basal body-associated protein FliL
MVVMSSSSFSFSTIWLLIYFLFFIFSITTCAYILMQFQKLSSQEHSQDPEYLHDPMYYVLLRHPNKYVCKFTVIYF